MALLKIDDRTLALNILCGAEESYVPTEQITKLSSRLATLRNKLTEFKKREEEFMITEISPEIKSITDEITNINEETYPQLKELKKNSSN